MKFAGLLEELIKTSGVQKQALSAALSYSPSEISKYLTGKRLPPANTINEVVNKCALFFSDAYWLKGREAGLWQLLPVQVPFRNKNELTELLKSALREALLLDFNTQQEVPFLASPDESTLLKGWASIVQTLVLSYSKAIKETGKVVCYYTLDTYLELLNKRALPLPSDQYAAQFEINLLISPGAFDARLSLQSLRLLMEHWHNKGKPLNIKFWQGGGSATLSYAFVPDQFALQLITSLPNSPVGAFMRNGRYLMEFELLNVTMFSQQITHPMQEIAQWVEDGHGDELLEKVSECEGIYTFDNVMFFARDKYLQGMSASSKVKDFVVKVMDLLTSQNLDLVVSLDAVGAFGNSGDVQVPLIGLANLDGPTSVAHMKTYEEIVQNKLGFRVLLTQTSYPLCTFAILKDEVLVMFPLEGATQQYLLLPKKSCSLLIQELEAIKSAHSFSISPDLWMHYIHHLPKTRK